MARVSRSRRHTKEQRRQQNQKQKGKQSTESHKSPPRGEQSLDGRGGGPVAPGTLPNKDSLAGSGRRQVGLRPHADSRDRKSTRLNSSHVAISYAVFCLKKKK